MSWRDDIIEKENQTEIAVENKPANESDEHYMRKIILCHALEGRGGEVLELEDSDNFEGLRFDATVKSPNGKTVGIEAGDFNCPSRKIVDRMKKSYEAGVEAIYWWPYGTIADYMGVFESFQTEFNKYCVVENDDCEGLGFMNLLPFVKTVPPSLADSRIYSINLVHMFEPHIFHQEVAELEKE